jgi:hypothetical protein
MTLPSAAQYCWVGHLAMQMTPGSIVNRIAATAESVRRHITIGSTRRAPISAEIRSHGHQPETVKNVSMAAYCVQSGYDLPNCTEIVRKLTSGLFH